MSDVSVMCGANLGGLVEGKVEGRELVIRREMAL